MSDELPKGWAMPLLGEVVKIKQGNSKLTKKWFKPDGKYVAFSGSGPDGLVDEFEYEGKAIVLSAVGARCGKCFKADGKWTAIANTAVVRPLIEDDSHYEYLFYLLNNENFWPKGGTAQPFVQTGLAQRETRMPLAPLAEQRRIVAKLEKLLSQVDASQHRLEKMPTLLKRFRQSVLAAACSGRLTADWRESEAAKDEDDLTLPAGWRLLELKEVADTIDPNPSHRYPSYENGVVPILATEQMRGLNDWDVSNAKLVNPAFHAERMVAHGFHSSDIIFARKGRLGLARRTPKIDRFVFSHTIFIIRAKGDAPADYLLWFLRQNSCVTWLLAEMNSNTGVPTLGKGYMERLPVAWPPVAEQQEIVRRVAGLFALADQLELRLAQARRQVEQLTPSLLARAFAGQLVPQDPADEPAAKLLERIKTTKK